MILSGCSSRSVFGSSIPCETRSTLLHSNLKDNKLNVPWPKRTPAHQITQRIQTERDRERSRRHPTQLTMTIAASPSPATQQPPNHNASISLALLSISFLSTLYTHTNCPQSNSHMPCTTLNNLTLGLAVLLSYIAAVRIYTSQDGRIMFPLAVACYFGVLGVLVLSGVEDLRTGLGYILGVEVVVVGVFFWG
jgi:hypothetical protein